MTKLSVAIITYNEEQHIGKCLDSVKDIADEVVVVDSYSNDKTPQICEQKGARVISQEFLGYIEQKNFALDQCTHDQVLSLDGDEALSEEARASIKKAKENWQDSGYVFNRLTNYAGHWVKHCGWYPDRKLRLVNRKKARWQGVNPHDILTMNDGSEGNRLNGDILHYCYNSVSDHINQTNRFTTINAIASYERGVRSSMFKIVTRPVLKFVKDYFLKLGFLDGRYGFVICYINALSAFLKYTKIKELQDGKKLSLN